jgi:hypothetical protein
MLEPELAASGLTLGYRGLDQVVRRTRIRYDPAPDTLTAGRAEFQLSLAPKQDAHVYLAVACEPDAVDAVNACRRR